MNGPVYMKKRANVFFSALRFEIRLVQPLLNVIKYHYFMGRPEISFQSGRMQYGQLIIGLMSLASGLQSVGGYDQGYTFNFLLGLPL